MAKYAIIMGVLSGFTPLFAATPGPVTTPDLSTLYPLADNGAALLSHDGALDYQPGVIRVREVHYRMVTGYSSTPEETDDTPFITASGSHVRPGVVAANWLPIGTKIRIPEYFGNEVFVVEDRMHSRHADKVDVWFAEKTDARKFGLRLTKIEVL